jgi:hypothetical protein
MSSYSYNNKKMINNPNDKYKIVTPIPEHLKLKEN